MSASPLPAVPAVSQTPVASTSSQAAPNNQRNSDAAFNAHLQHAQRQQSSTPDSDTQADQDNAGKNSSTQAGDDQAASTQASNAAKPGTDPNAADAAQASAADDSSATSSVGSLASTVLSLIDQATGDADSGTATTATKSASEKPASPSTNSTQQPSPAAQAVAVIPPLLPTPVSAASSAGNGGADASVSALQTNGTNANSILAMSGQAAQKSSAATADFNSGDDADDSDTGASNGAGASNALLQSVGDGTQALASSLFAGVHAAAGATSASPATNSTTQSAPDLAALRGVFDASALAAPSGTTGTAGHSLNVDSPVGSSGFAKELGQQVTWLSGQDVKQAQIRLNPQDLGPLDVKVSVEHGRVDVAFMTQHPAAAAAVQQGLGQLNQMLGGQGLSLGHTTVGQHGAQQQFAGQQQQQSDARASGSADDTVENTAVSTLQRVAVGLVDAFA